MTPKPLTPLMPKDVERFHSKYQKTEGCWEWTCSTGRKGYAVFHFNRKPTRASRYAWWLAYGTDPGRFLVCHRCDNPKCVRPDHLFLGTARDNALDAVRKGRQSMLVKTHCPQGHPYSGDNLGIQNGGDRICRTCRKEQGARKRAVNREAIREKQNAQRVAIRKQVYALLGRGFSVDEIARETGRAPSVIKRAAAKARP